SKPTEYLFSPGFDTISYPESVFGVHRTSQEIKLTLEENKVVRIGTRGIGYKINKCVCAFFGAITLPNDIIAGGIRCDEVHSRRSRDFVSCTAYSRAKFLHISRRTSFKFHEKGL